MATTNEPSYWLPPKWSEMKRHPRDVCPFAGAGILCSGYFYRDLKREVFVLDYHDCERCGWNPEEQERRQELLKNPKNWELIKKKGVFNVPWQLLES